MIVVAAFVLEASSDFGLLLKVGEYGRTRKILTAQTSPSMLGVHMQTYSEQIAG